LNKDRIGFERTGTEGIGNGATAQKERITMSEEKVKKSREEKPDGTLTSNVIHVEATFLHPVLGTAPGNPDLYAEFIGQKSDVDSERIKDELASLPAEELEAKGKTVFHRDDDGNPCLLDYQIKGMLKQAFVAFCEFGDIKLGKNKISKWTAKRIVDLFVFVYPREIPLMMPEGSELEECVRPLRGEIRSGGRIMERVALACSERSPKGTKIRFSVEWLRPELEKTVMMALNYGSKNGIGQWRNSGMGRFEWTVIGDGEARS
jgi:hypothetical protein